MLSKNNYHEKLRKMEPRKERFSIRKFSIGAASVLIGFSFMSMAGNQKAQAAEQQEKPAVVQNAKDNEQSQSSAGATLEAKMGGVNSATTANKTATDSKLTQSPIQDSTHSSANTEANKLTNSANSNVQAGQSNDLTISNKEDSTNVENKTAVLNTDKKQTSLTKDSLRDEKVAAASVESTATKNLRGTQSQDVNDWQGFVNAMNDSSVGTIKLTSDITVANKGTNVNGIHRPQPLISSGKMNLTGSNISGGLDIDGQNHTINFGANYLSFDTNNQKNSNPWDIAFKNLTINADGYDNSWGTLGGAFSPIYMGGDDINTSLLAKNKVTFENVTADVKNGAFYNTTMAQQVTDNPYTTVTFKGNNNITVEAVNVAGNQLYNYSSAVSASHIVFADGTNTVFNVSSAKTNNDQNAGGNILRAKVEDSSDTTPAIDVQEGATVTLNGKSTDVKGMLVNNAITGTVQVDGNLNANMADGHSMAIWAGNLNIGKAGVVNINTKQSNDGSGLNGVTNYNGYHFAPISLGVGFAANVTNADANTLDNQGKLTIVRSGDNTSTSPLISFGSGSAAALTGKFTLNVTDGATLDLQDSAQSSIAGATTNTPNIGLITMWGSGSSSTANNINITNPAYVNLQRTGKQTGTLIRLENLTNHVTVQSNGANNPLPLAQWDEGNYNNPSYYWYINNLTSHNNWGNNSISGFAKQGQTAGANKAGEAKFLHSNGIVTMGGSQAGLNQYQYTDGTITQGQPDPGVDYETPYLNKFLNNFNWWTPQQISMGTNLETKVTPTDADKYQPVVQTIDGNTSQTLKDLTAKAGIKGLLSGNGTETDDLSSVKSVSWYDAATDANEWKSVMGNEAEPTNPTGNLKTSDKSAWAKVTYTDGSVDFANIPLKITEPMAQLYTPSYKPVNVEQGQTAAGAPSFTDQDGKDVTAPTGTTFTTGTDTPDWASIDPSTGTVTVKPSTEVTPGAYNVPVTVTYSDKSTDETTVPVIVTKAGQTVTWGDNGAVVTTVDTSKLNAHETTENSQVLSPATVVTAEGYELTDGKISTTATPITIDPSTVSWTTTPNTNVETATAAGKEITASVTVDFTNNDAAKNILGSKNGVVTTNPFTIDAKGAGAKNITTPVTVALGSALTSEQFGQLVENNIPTDEIASTTWETKPDANGNGGVIKITFTDKDANGNPTYLNVNIPASSIKVTTDAEINTPQGQDVSTKVGEVPDAKKGIKNPDTLPNGTTYTWQNTPNTTTPGKKPAVIVVTYPDGSKDEVPTNVVVNAKPEIKTITTTVDGNPAATEGIANLNNGGTTPVDGYPTSATWTTKPDTSKPGATTGTATVTYPDGTTETVTIPVAVNGQGDVTVIDNGHVFSLHANNVVTHKTSDKNIIGGPVIENFKLSYYQGGQNYSKPYIYTLNADKTAYVLTQTGDNPAGVTVDAPQSINASDIKISWTADGTVLFNNALGPIKGNGQPSSLASDNNGGTKTITYTNWVNNQFGYPKYSAVVNSSGVNWPIYGKGPVSTYPFPSVYIYGAEANGTIPSVNSDVSDLKTALGDASKLVNTNDLTADHNSEISSVNWQTLPSLAEANAKAPATVRINFTDGSYLDVPVAVNVIKVDQGVDDKTNHDIYRDITRTINVEGESTPVVQHVIYSRAKITDLSKPAGQQISYTDWAAAKNSEGQAVTNFPQYEVTKPGYTATATGATIETVDGKQYVPASATITPDSSNETVNVTYTANEHTLVINYVDGNGTVVGTYNVPGKTNEIVNVDVLGHVPTNWKLVPKQQVIGSYKFGSNDPQPVDYKVEHGTKVVPVDKNDKDTYRKITQTIQEVPAGKTNADMHVVRTASVEFERTGVKDLVTGDIAWNAWNSNSETFPVYNIKEQKGYDSYVNGVKATEVAAVTVDPDSQNITDTITYVKQAATPVPYDPSNKDMNKSVTRTINYEVPAGHEAIAPVTQTVEYTRDVNGVAGYQDPVTGEITWNPWHVKSGKAEFASASVEQIKGYDSYVDGTKTTEVPAAAVTEKDGVPQNGANVTVSYQKQADTPVPYKPGQEGVNDDMNQYVTRTIVVHEPDQDPVSHDQTVHFTREDAQGNAGYTDPVTGKITWNAWHVAGELNQANGTWAEFNAPTVKGYTPSQAKVAAEEVTAETKNVIVDIKYAPVAPTGQNVTTKVGEVPDASQGIANKDDLPDGTKYSWKTTPDVSTEGEKPAVVIVTYPGGSPVEVPVTVTVTKNPTDADKYTPEGQDVNTKTGVVPNPAEGIKNKSDLPDGTKYTWKDTPDVTTAGDKPATVVVSYPDGSKDEVPVTIHVTNPATDADKYTPEGQDVNTKTGVVPNPAEGIKNKGDLPDGTKYTWKDTPDVTTAGDKPATVVVSYPDGSKDEVPVTIHVTNPATDADKYTPEGQDVNTKTGVVPNPAEGIKNKSDLPDGTKYTWKDTPDVTTAGDKPATVVVSYPDGSKDEVPVTIHVTNPATDADKYTPEGQDVNTKTSVVPNPAEGIKNKSDLPDGTKYTWKDTPDVTKPGESTGVIVVTYPDGSKDEVPVTIHVTNPATDADKYTPEGQDVNTKTGVVPNPAEGIKNKSDLPDGTKYTWKDTPDVTKPGESTGVIVVTYPDGSKDEVTVKVVVNTNDVTPETQPIHTTLGVLPNPADAIKNKDEMPVGTKYTWKEVPNVNTLGEHTGVITVTYPDGSSVDLTVKVYVDAVAKENNSNNTAQVITKHVAETNEKKTSATPAQQINHSEKATLPQTGAKSENAAGILGLAIAAVGSLFGLAADKKRRDK
ncbi:Rib/alpha-like domain-containing protein [Lactobacillus taiwanensis]|uniref:Rib/alpha-like domain-containing protein n=2 Tax=Lactobacillus taiwanensis TaxID=508451 RepID=UPI001AEC2C9A|nr:Rib/alpha-like domain-containing protein [Lactobacillus taiwanensis]QTQ39751.1 YSIRK-type signal peptide-containing protein [Lactobacillus taiwanensis]